MDRRNVVIGAMVLVIALLVGLNVAMYMGSQEQNITQLDWADNATTDMRYANESPAPVSVDKTMKPTIKHNRTSGTGGSNGTDEKPEPEPQGNETS